MILQPVIVAVPERMPLVRRLVAALGEDVPVSVDLEHMGCVPNTWAAVELARTTCPEATHLLVLNDDVIPCRDLIETCRRLIEVLPGEVISLFNRSQDAIRARAAERSWVRQRAPYMDQGLIMRVDYLEELDRRWKAWRPTSNEPLTGKGCLGFDGLRKRLYPTAVWQTVPSLVEHDASARSTIPGHGGARVASWFIGADASGLTVDWTRGIEKAPGRTPRQSPPPTPEDGNAVKLEMVPLSKVRPYANNPRLNEQAVAAVAASIERYGYNQPVVLDGEFVIVAGDTRYRALVQLYGDGAEVPMLVHRGLTAKQAREYRIADNATYDLATWHFEHLQAEIRTLDVGSLAPFYDPLELQRLQDSLPALAKRSRALTTTKSAEEVRTGIDRDQLPVDCPKCQGTFYVDRRDVEVR